MPEHLSPSIAHCLPLEGWEEGQRGDKRLACSVISSKSLNLSEPQVLIHKTRGLKLAHVQGR